MSIIGVRWALTSRYGKIMQTSDAKGDVISCQIAVVVCRVGSQ